LVQAEQALDIEIAADTVVGPINDHGDAKEGAIQILDEALRRGRLRTCRNPFVNQQDSFARLQRSTANAEAQVTLVVVRRRHAKRQLVPGVRVGQALAHLDKTDTKRRCNEWAKEKSESFDSGY
jgi:hypothetical protein